MMEDVVHKKAKHILCDQASAPDGFYEFTGTGHTELYWQFCKYVRELVMVTHIYNHKLGTDLKLLRGDDWNKLVYVESLDDVFYDLEEGLYLTYESNRPLVMVLKGASGGIDRVISSKDLYVLLYEHMTWNDRLS